MYNNVKKFSDYTYYLEFMKIVSTVKNRNIETLAINLSRYFGNFSRFLMIRYYRLIIFPNKFGYFVYFLYHPMNRVVNICISNCTIRMNRVIPGFNEVRNVISYFRVFSVISGLNYLVKEFHSLRANNL